ncbi:MAG: heavy metal translocating P-type ATPase [Clostridiales bacterium]|nr:heavy metal translocating P-type ATPase [Clostridiales bacterium]
MVQNVYTVTGMTCSACSSGIERALNRLDGVELAEVSLMGKSLKIKFDEGVVSEEKIFLTVTELGYKIYKQNQTEEVKADNNDKLFARFIASVCILLPLIYLSMGNMLGAPLPFFINPNNGYGAWFALTQAILALIVIIINFAFFKNGVIALIKRVPNMDTLVALGSGVSYIYSAVLTVLVFCGQDLMHLHFESAAMILTFVTVGKWLEEKSKKKTGSEIEKLLKLAPDSVTVEENGEQRIISVKQVKRGDILVVKQGDYLPVDGEIVFGTAIIDKSAITGESLPVEVTVGDKVTSATLNKSGLIKIKAESVGEDTTLSKIIKMVKEAGASKAPIQKIADKVAGIFVPTVAIISLLTALIWLIIDQGFNPDHSITYAISVLVVSCPCALGLATPVAIMTATGKAASLGILYKDAESLQRLCNINCILIDKTATLTYGSPEVTDIVTFDFNKELALKIACGIEINSNHPLAKCIVDYAKDGVQVQNFEYCVGKGAIADYDGERYYLGNERLISRAKINRNIKDEYEKLSSCGKTVIYLANNSRVVALIAVADKIKATSKNAVNLLKQRGLRVAMLTGDEKATAKAVADSVGINEFLAEVMPEDKYTAVINTQSVGGCVAMVGDGINDAPALKQADVGIAIGSGTDVAIDSAGVVLVNEDIQSLDTVFDLSKATVKNIKQNLFWAFFYNIIMIPVAAGALSFVGIYFNPMIASVCMSLSSLFVVFNALRLLNYKNKNITKVDDYMKKIIHIEGMCCQHCAKRVVNAISVVKNVISADVKLKKNIAVIRSREEVLDEEIIKVVKEAGYTVTSIENK